MEQISAQSANVYENKPNDPYKVSFRKIARAAAAEVHVHKKVAMISFVLFGVAMLLFMFNAYFYDYSNAPAEFVPSGWGIAFGIGGILTGFSAALNVFRDMNNQQLCDVAMALPIKSSERFFSKLLALFYLQVIPLTVSVLGGNGAAIFFGSLKYGTLDSDTAQRLFIILFVALSASMFFMALAVLCVCCCGAPAESAYFSIIWMFIVNALPVSIIYIVGMFSGFQNIDFFYQGGDDIKIWGFLTLLSEEDELIPRSLISIVISLVVMLLSIFIFRKRDARSVGTPIASRLFFEVMMMLGSFTIFSFFQLASALQWGLLVAGVAYIIINIIVSRAKINVLSFLKWIGKYAVTAAAFMALMAAAIKTGGFGRIGARPDTKYLDGAEFSISYHINDYGYVSITTSELTAEQADQVMDICKKHIAKGSAGVSLFDTMFGIYDRDTAYIYVRADSDKEFTTGRPRPKILFDERHNGKSVYYTLNYIQSIRITTSEARALTNELKKLDFVDVRENPYTYW
ncbi:MAG: hypothetical protein K2J80_13560 [Oscillospiraceae bacterium]|nr:hypothetical protein [Oscillospiraceae bacterium]